MKRTLLLCATLLAPPLLSHAQQESRAWVGEISADSMRTNLEWLAGERSVYVRDSVLVYGRYYDDLWLHDTTIVLTDRRQESAVAGQLLYERLEAYGYEPWFDRRDSVFSYPLGSMRANSVLAAIGGATTPERQIILCAHFDTVSRSPGADDNGSGTVAVLEIARMLVGTAPDRSILFAFWDREEDWAGGSRAYVEDALARGDVIDAVINLDMIGWNKGDPTMLVADFDGQSEWLVERVLAIRDSLGLAVEPRAFEGGGSDHVPFAQGGYPAVMLTEDDESESNPYYHTPQDRIEHIDFGFLREITQLAAASVISLAYHPESLVSSDPVPAATAFSARPYPVPASQAIRFAIDGAGPGPVGIEVFDVMGRRVGSWVGDRIDVGQLPEGLYLYRVVSGNHSISGILPVIR